MIDIENFLQEFAEKEYSLYTEIKNATCTLIDLNKRLEKIIKQNAEGQKTTDTLFEGHYEQFYTQARQQLNQQMEYIAKAREIACQKLDLKNCSLQVKTISNRVRDLQTAEKNFSQIFAEFWKNYQSTNAIKVSAWLLPSFQHDLTNLIDRCVVLARTFQRQIKE